jgi:chaperonin GroES
MPREPRSTPGSSRARRATSPRKAAAKAAAPKRVRRSAKAEEEIRLTGDRLVVREPGDGERTSRGGLLIPATAAPTPRRCQWAEVALVGPDVRGVRKGDRVLFLPQAGLEVELGEEDYLLLRERDVQAVATAVDDSTRDHGQYL